MGVLFKYNVCIRLGRISLGRHVSKHERHLLVLAKNRRIVIFGNHKIEQVVGLVVLGSGLVVVVVELAVLVVGSIDVVEMVGMVVGTVVVVVGMMGTDLACRIYLSAHNHIWQRTQLDRHSQRLILCKPSQLQHLVIPIR
jgi:hypothetical protein